jgi:hypothetical protein
MRYLSTLKLPTYQCRVIVIVTDDLNKEGRRIYKKHDLEVYEDDEAEGMVICPDLTQYYLVISKVHLTYNTIAHECHHVVQGIVKDRGIEDDEAGAWLAGHISEFVYKFLQKRKLGVKHG